MPRAWKRTLRVPKSNRHPPTDHVLDTDVQKPHRRAKSKPNSHLHPALHPFGARVRSALPLAGAFLGQPRPVASRCCGRFARLTQSLVPARRGVRSGQEHPATLVTMLYTGAMEKGQMHGKGALVYPNNERYEVRGHACAQPDGPLITHASGATGRLPAWQAARVRRLHVCGWRAVRGRVDRRQGPRPGRLGLR